MNEIEYKKALFKLVIATKNLLRTAKRKYKPLESVGITTLRVKSYFNLLQVQGLEGKMNCADIQFDTRRDLTPHIKFILVHLVVGVDTSFLT